jgi:hypothetical protein
MAQDAFRTGFFNHSSAYGASFAGQKTKSAGKTGNNSEETLSAGKHIMSDLVESF